MNENKTALLKIFSSVLKDRSKTEPQYQLISPEMVKFFSRKELIEIITHNFDGEVPEDYNLVELENRELLQLIGDNYSIIFYVMGKWSKEALQLPTLQEWMDSKVHSSAENISESSTKTDTEQKPAENTEKKSESAPKTENILTTPQAKVSESPKPSGQKPEDKKPEEKKQDDKKPDKK